MTDQREKDLRLLKQVAEMMLARYGEEPTPERLIKWQEDILNQEAIDAFTEMIVLDLISTATKRFVEENGPIWVEDDKILITEDNTFALIKNIAITIAGFMFTAGWHSHRLRGKEKPKETAKDMGFDEFAALVKQAVFWFNENTNMTPKDNDYLVDVLPVTWVLPVVQALVDVRSDQDQKLFPDAPHAESEKTTKDAAIMATVEAFYIGLKVGQHVDA